MTKKQQARILALAVYQLLQSITAKEEAKKIVDNFLIYLKKHHLFFLLVDILNELKVIYYSQHGILPAKIISRYNLDKAFLDELIQIVEAKTHKKIQPILIRDNQVIGGLKIRYSDKLLDMTIAKQLNELTKQFIN